MRSMSKISYFFAISLHFYLNPLPDKFNILRFLAESSALTYNIFKERIWSTLPKPKKNIEQYFKVITSICQLWEENISMKRNFCNKSYKYRKRNEKHFSIFLYEKHLLYEIFYNYSYLWHVIAYFGKIFFHAFSCINIIKRKDLYLHL